VSAIEYLPLIVITSEGASFHEILV